MYDYIEQSQNYCGEHQRGLAMTQNLDRSFQRGNEERIHEACRILFRTAAAAPTLKQGHETDCNLGAAIYHPSRVSA